MTETDRLKEEPGEVNTGNGTQEEQGTMQTVADAASSVVDKARQARDRIVGAAGDEYGMPPQFEEDDEVIRYLEEARDANRRLPPEEVKRLRRKQRTEEVVSGISDAVRSLSNLYFTTEYAPDMYDHTKGMSAATKARWDKAWKEREAENDRSLDYAMKIRSIKGQQAATRYQQARDKVLEELKEREQTRKENHDNWLAETRRLELEIKQAQAANNQELAKQKLEELKEHNRAMERNGYLSATRPRSSGGGGRGGGGSAGQYPWYDSNGNLHYAKSKAAAEENARLHGTDEEYEETTTSKSPYNGTTTRKKTTRRPKLDVKKRKTANL